MSMVGQAHVAPPRPHSRLEANVVVGQTGKKPLDQATDNSIGDKQVAPEAIIEALRQVHDPEIPVNIYDLGLIYRVDIVEGGAVNIDMTVTAPGCPVAQEFPGMVEAEVCRVPGVKSAHVEIVWEPPWSPERMTDEAKLELGML